MILSLLKRTEDVALMKKLCANSVRTTIIFLSEALLIGLALIACGLLSYPWSWFFRDTT
jgi:ABC-type lipoprotein release transport system permease subunit